MTQAGDLESRTSSTMRRFLDLEDEAPSDLLEVLPGATVPFWALVRMQIFWMLSAEHTGSVDVVRASEWTRWGEARRVARGYLPSRWDAVRRAGRHDVAFYVSGGTLALDGDKARNWLVDDFAEAAGDALVVQTRPLPAAIGLPAFRPTLSMESATARSRWRARGTAPSQEAIRSMDRLLDAFARHLDQPPGAFAPIGRRVRPTELLRPLQLEELSRLLERVQPKVVLFDNGSYTYHGEWVGLMKDAGAWVAEPQHGWIGPSHAAYNYGAAFEEAALRRALPDEVLTFGSYWSDSIRHPGVVTAIGKPHLEREASSVPETRARRILVVSSRTDPDATDAFVVGLRAALGGEWSIVFRPHPGERSETSRRYPSLSADSGVTIDDAPDVYATLKQSAVVIGEASTVLYEARAFGCHVIPRDSPFADSVIGDAFGDRVSDVAQAVRRIEALAPDHTGEAPTDSSIWAPQSVASFREWVSGRRAQRRAP
ncbi:hypothetical protein [Microbacterium sulfonylureivorans]|uniref:hypothetical protein n=1 Tax=Microbacterium sulfonylureivorans TaxID=2486854 RepID=UPI000FDCC6C0|nr:hypothetical protein [Microbacterium sulfonylureivorans]